ncbi:MAG: Ig-like domain-containing protein [Gemmatimonadota bacterium]|nr:Ig-like domain-containing protein [Gemmatimonadota bacterium]
MSHSRLPRARAFAFALIAGLMSACGGSEAPACSPTDPGCDAGDGNGDGNGNPTALAVTQVSPNDGTTGVATDAAVTITFSRAVAAASVTSTSVTVGSLAGTRDVSGSTVTFTPDDAMAEATSYTVSVTGVTDADGVGLDGAFSSSFTTVSSPAMADAGPDVSITAGAESTLDGSASTGSGATYTWTVLEGPSVGSLSGATPTFTAPDEIGKMVVELSVSGGSGSDADTVQVWILEDADHALWVSPAGSDSNPGTREAPIATIQAAIDAADGAGNGADVYIAGGEYMESVTLRSRVSLYAGWDEADWSRNIETRRAVVRGGATAVQGTESNNLVLEGLEVIAADATDPGESSVAVWLLNSTGVDIRRNIIRAGAGAMGVSGTTPNRTRTGSTGSRGGNARLCVSRTSGGSGGSNYRSGGNGGLGGGTNPTGGSSGSTSNGGGGGSAGTSGSKNGGRGRTAATTGPVGGNGAAGSAFGAINESGEYVAEAAGGNTGTNGSAGYGGGGGGGAYGLVGLCGGSGGGGGGGGEGGQPGTGGMGGGASFAVLAVGPGSISIGDNELHTADGGVGGRGATGGAGGLGGSGNVGGTRGCDSLFPSICTGTGGRGGNGSAGGRGGHGGGGGGGPSIAVIEGPTTTITLSGNTFMLGEGGAGGPSSGNSGPAGEAAEQKKLTP